MKHNAVTAEYLQAVGKRFNPLSSPWCVFIYKSNVEYLILTVSASFCRYSVPEYDLIYFHLYGYSGSPEKRRQVLYRH